MQLALEVGEAKKPVRPRDGNAEARIQAAIIHYVRTVAPHVLIFHVPNGGLRSRTEAARMKWQGVTAGVPDLVLVLPGGRVAFWEVKAPKRMLTGEQLEFGSRLRRLGHDFAVIRSIEDAREALAALGIATREVR